MIQAQDSLTIIKEARRLEKKIRKEDWNIDLRIAVLGSYAIQHFVMALKYVLNLRGINADIYEGEYNGIIMEVFNNDSRLYQYHPDIVIILPHDTDIKEYPALLDRAEIIQNSLEEYFLYYKNIWQKLSENLHCQILQSNFVIPPLHILGNLECKLECSKTNFLKNLNNRLYKEAPDYVNIIDLELLAENIGKYQWFDYSAYFLTKSGFKLDYLKDVVLQFVNQICAYKGKTRKCLVLDLDNTLWGGIIGDDGVDGIQLDPNNAVGEAYIFFQKYVLELKKRGVILAVCSKNEEVIAKEPFEHNEYMILKLDDISCFVANWEDKVSNIKKIAFELNIGTDSLVFFDDNPAEREIVNSYLPEVHVVDVPKDPAFYALQLDKEAPFEWLQLTKEDLLRSNSYIQNKKREKMVQQFADYSEYLKALEMRGEVEKLERKDVGRFTQLLNKSNQFNLRTQRYSEAEIIDKINGENSCCLCARLIDKFSDYGLISCVILQKRNTVCFIESWVMSCRVLKRDIEKLMFAKIIVYAKEMNCTEIRGEYIPTLKNKMVCNFLDTLGFKLISDDSVKLYSYDVDVPYFIENVYIEQLANYK